MALRVIADTQLCMHECGGQCCRGPSYLQLMGDEVMAFAQLARALGVDAVIHRVEGGGVVRFLEHRGERCPMLVAQTASCRIYETRPARCRAFPEAPREGCALSVLRRARGA